MGQKSIEEIVKFSLAEAEMMTHLEIPIEQDLDLGFLDSIYENYRLDESDKLELSDRTDCVIKYREIVKKYLGEDPNELFKKVFGRAPKGEIDLKIEPYYLSFISSETNEWGGSSCAYIPKRNPMVKIPELKGLVIVRTKLGEEFELILNLGGGRDSALHERQHLRYLMVVRKDEYNLFSDTEDSSEYPFIDQYEDLLVFYEDEVKDEFAATLAGAEGAETMPLFRVEERINFYRENALSHLEEYKESSNPVEVEKIIDKYEAFFVDLEKRSTLLTLRLEMLTKTIPMKILSYILSNTTIDRVLDDPKGIKSSYVKLTS